MANSLKTNPIVLDTAGATSKISGPLSFTAIRFVAAADADEVVLMNYNGDKVIYATKCKTPNFVENFCPQKAIDCPHGINLTTLTAGKVYLYS